MPAALPTALTLRCLAVLLPLMLAPTAWAATTLAERYQQLKSGSLATLPGTTLSLLSAEDDGQLSADVTNILPYDYATAASALLATESWCQFMPLHFNIKACTYEKSRDGELLTLYSGRKGYQSPEESHALIYRVEKREQAEERFQLRLRAASGPVNTRDYLIEVEGLRVEEGLLVHIRSSYRPSLSSALLTRTYLSTLGREKAGFTRSSDGNGDYIQGMRGLIERNVMRYQLAVETFLATQAVPETARHEAALLRWFKRNESYPRQLHEMEEGDYLAIKRREWQNQRQLQQALNDKLRLVSREQRLGSAQ